MSELLELPNPFRENVVQDAWQSPADVPEIHAAAFKACLAGIDSASAGVADSLLIYGAANGLGYPRLGMTASRRFGGAVARNRWKRLVREAFRLSQHDLPALDLVCIPRGHSEPELNQLLAELPALAARIDARLRQQTGRSTGKAP